MNGRTRFTTRGVLLTTIAAALLTSAAWAQEKKEAPYVGPASAFKDKKTIAEKLATDIEINVVETPLKDVAKLLQEAIGTTVELAAKHLEEAAISLDTPITKNLKGVRLVSALKLLLDDLDLAYIEDEQYLLITTPEHAESRLHTRVYDVRELLALPPADRSLPPPIKLEPMSRAGSPAAPVASVPPGISPQFGGGLGGGQGFVRPPSDADELINLIQSTVFPQSWDEVGGPGSIVEYKGLVVISQTSVCHQEIERLLNMLHEAAGLANKKVKVVR